MLARRVRPGPDRPAVGCDHVTTVPKTALGAQIGMVLDHQEPALTLAIRNAFDLD